MTRLDELSAQIGQLKSKGGRPRGPVRSATELRSMARARWNRWILTHWEAKNAANLRRYHERAAIAAAEREVAMGRG